MDVQSRPKHSWDPCLCFRAPCSVCVSVVRAPLFDSCVCFASRLQGNGGSPFPKRKIVRRRGQNEKANEGASENVRSLSLGASGGARHRCHPKSEQTRQPPMTSTIDTACCTVSRRPDKHLPRTWQARRQTFATYVATACFVHA